MPRARWLDISSPSAAFLGTAPDRPRWHRWLDTALDIPVAVAWFVIDAFPLIVLVGFTLAFLTSIR